MNSYLLSTGTVKGMEILVPDFARDSGVSLIRGGNAQSELINIAAPMIGFWQREYAIGPI
jgi:hypothetical protein